MYAIRSYYDPAGLTSDELHEAFRPREPVLVERDHRALGAGVDLVDPGIPAQPLDGDDLQQRNNFV